MYKILLAGMDQAENTVLAKTLQADSRITCEHADGGREALAKLNEKPADLVIASEQLTDMTGIEFANQLVRQHPMVNCALVSTLSEEEFHEASEGLGILGQLAPDPDESQIRDLLQKLAQILGPGH